MQDQPIRDWVATARCTPLGTDGVHIFSANHVGIFVLSRPIPDGHRLVGLEARIRFPVHEDYDFAGLAVDQPASKQVMIGVSARNRQVEAKGTGLAVPCDVELERPCHLAVRLDRTLPAGAPPEYDIVFDDRVVGRWTRPVTAYGVCACEADVEITDIRVELEAI